MKSKKYVRKIRMWLVAEHFNKKNATDKMLYFVNEAEADEALKNEK